MYHVEFSKFLMSGYSLLLLYNYFRIYRQSLTGDGRLKK